MQILTARINATSGTFEVHLGNNVYQDEMPDSCFSGFHSFVREDAWLLHRPGTITGRTALQDSVVATTNTRQLVAQIGDPEMIALVADLEHLTQLVTASDSADGSENRGGLTREEAAPMFSAILQELEAFIPRRRVA